MYWLVLLYVIVFYTQPGSRFPMLGAIRIELLIGVVILGGVLLTKWQMLVRLTRLNKAIFIFFSSLCFSFFGAVWTHTASHSIDVLLNIFKFFSIYIMMIGTINSERKLRLFTWVYIGSICFYYTEPFLLSLRGLNFHYEGGMMHLMGVGQFAHYNSLGGITASNLAFLAQLFFYYGWLLKVLFLVFAGIGMRVIMLTGSRTAYVGVIMLGILLVFFSKHKIRNFILIAIIGVGLFTLMPQEYKARFMTLQKATQVVEGEQVQDSMSTRWQIIKDAWNVFLKYPLVGCGLDSFYQIRGLLFGRWQQTHNLYMQVLTDMGIVGFVSFIYLLVTIWKYIVFIKHRLKINREEKSYLYRLATAIQMFLIMRLTVGMFGMDLYENYWWLMAGFSAVIYRLVQNKIDCKNRTKHFSKKGI